MSLDLHAIYAALSDSGPSVAGVVALAVALRTLQKTRLENEDLRRKAARAENEAKKLQLELRQLEINLKSSALSKEKLQLEIEVIRKNLEATSRVVISELTTEEVARYSGRSAQERKLLRTLSSFTIIRLFARGLIERIRRLFV